MVFVCLPKDKALAFRKALKVRDINLERLMKLTSSERVQLFKKYAGEQAKDINLLFEQKLILKNKDIGIRNLMQKVGQIGRYDPLKKVELERLMKEFKEKQKERIFSPKQNEVFLEALAEQILGAKVTKAEAGILGTLYSNAQSLKKNFNEKDWKWTNEKDRLNYGAAEVAYQNYIKHLKDEGLPLSRVLKNRLQQFKTTAGVNKPQAILELFGDTLKTISQNSIAIVASVDNSFLGRQGMKTLQTHPLIWARSARASFGLFYNTIRGKAAMDALYADIYSRPNYLNGRYEIAKLIPKFEEQFPTTLPERIPVAGRVFKASESAFIGTAVRMRADLFDLLIKYAENGKVDLTKKIEIESIGKIVTSLTARGELGRVTGSPAVTLVLWAPRMLKANFDFITAHSFDTTITSFARKQAVRNLLIVSAEMYTLYRITNALWPGTMDKDPRSTDFCKLKIGNTRFDLSGGACSLITLGARLATRESKSATTGIITELGFGVGKRNPFDVLVDFAVNKFTPVNRALVDILRGRTFKGEKPTFPVLTFNTAVPISIQNLFDLSDDNSADAVLGVLADFVGISASTYSAFETNWSLSEAKRLRQFYDKVGPKRFQEANDLFNKRYKEWFERTVNSSKFKRLSDDDKKRVLTNKRSQLTNEVLKKFGFKFKSEKSKPLPKFR